MAVTKFYPCNALILDATQDQAIVNNEGIEDTWASTKQSYSPNDILLASTVPAMTDSYLRFELNKGFEYNGTHRSELRSHWNKSYEGWVSFRIRVGSDYISDDATEILHQMHELGGSPQISFQCRNHAFFFEGKQGTFASNSAINMPFGDVVQNEWIDVIYNYKIHQTQGFLKAWRNGVQLVDYSGILGYSDSVEPPYWKFGIYKWLWSSSTYVSSTTQRIVLYDEIKFGDATATYDEMNPSYVNLPPTVAITYPEEGAQFDEGTIFEAIATASDSDGTIAQVQLFYNGIGANIELQSPYEFPLQLDPGNYALTAVAEDDDGATTTSDPVNITVNATVVPNVMPTVVITYPANGRKFREGKELTINADADDSDGTIAKVEFYIDNDLIGQSLSAPYQFTTTLTGAGDKYITAKATDNDGGEKMSSQVLITVLPDSTVGPYFTVKGLFKVINL